MKVTSALLVLSLVSASRALPGFLGAGAHFSVRMPYTNPAGVTYIEGPAPAGLAAGPLVQTAGVYSAPVARFASVASVTPVTPVAAPVPVTYTQQLRTASVGYAAVPTVQHVPAVQDVPYTRIEATPGFVQKQVDIAKPAIATRKYEVRRPAIQKEFYDIEERVVVRPAGSAVVELDQPLSKTQKGETVVQAAAPVARVATVATAAPVAVARVAAVAAPAQVAYAGFAPAYARYTPAFARYTSPFYYTQSTHFTQPIVAGPFPQANPTQIPSESPAQTPSQQAGQPQQDQQQQQQQEQSQEPQQQFDQPQQQLDQSQQQFDQSQQQFDQSQQQFDQSQQQLNQPQQQFDQPQQDAADDSVAVDNPDVSSRSSAPAPAPSQSPAPSADTRSAPQPSAPQPSAPAAAPQEDALRVIKAEEEAIEIQRQELAARMAQLEIQRRQQQQDFAALLARQRSLNVAAAAAVNPAFLRSSFPQPQYGLTEARFVPRSQPQQLAQPQPQPEFRSAQPQPQPESRSAQPQPQPQPQQQPQDQPQPSSTAAPSRPAVEVRSLGSPIENLLPAPRSGQDVVPSVRNLTPEQDQANQQRLIELFTAQVQRAFLYLIQGGVAEVGGQARAGSSVSNVLDAGQVRARVLSATPAPPGAEPTNERVSTRRVVVSRPIQTVQEVDEVEPFTKIHRVSVQQPALFKTARVDVARVHTAVPVYGKALTPYAVYHK